VKVIGLMNIGKIGKIMMKRMMIANPSNGCYLMKEFSTFNIKLSNWGVI